MKAMADMKFEYSSKVVGQSWPWVRVYLNLLEHLNGIHISVCGFESDLGQLSKSLLLKAFSGEYHMHQFIPLYSCAYLSETSIVVNAETNKGNGQDKIWTLDKRWNWSSCTTLATLRASRTQDLMTQSIRGSKWDSPVMGSIPFKPAFWKTSSKNPPVVNIIYIIYVCIYVYIYVYIKYIYFIYYIYYLYNILYIYLSIYLSLYLSTYIYIYICICIYIYVYIYIYIYIYIYSIQIHI